MFLGENKQKRERIIALDLLRGTFLVVIFINHIAWYPTFFDILTGRSHLFASAAEGFFAISGVLVGYVYGPRILRKTKETFTHLIRRAGWLYVLAIGFSLLYTTIASLFLEPGSLREMPPIPDVGTMLYQTFTLQFHFGWADFLSRYAVLMLIAPFVLWLIGKKLWWLVGVISVVVWALFNNSGLNTITSWQLVFFGGIIIGYHLPQIESWAKSLPKRTKKIAVYSLFSIALLTFAISISLTVIIPTLQGELHTFISPSLNGILLAVINFRAHLDDTIFNKDSLALGRLVIGVIWFASLYILYRQFEKQIDSFTKGSLLILGTNSLFVYGLQAFILFIMDIFLRPTPDATIITKTIVTTVALYILYEVTRRRSEIRNFRKRIIKV